MKSDLLGFRHRFIPVGNGGVVGAAPTLLALHGTGGDENDLVPLAQHMLSGANVVSPRGKVLENGMPRFFRRLAEGVFDLEDLTARTHELADFVGAAAEASGLDRSRVYAVGFSNGANVAAATLLLRPMVPLVPERPPALAGVPVLISAGDGDPIAPPGETRRLAELLHGYGAAVEVARQPVGHNLSQGDVDVARDWLAKVTRGA